MRQIAYVCLLLAVFPAISLAGGDGAIPVYPGAVLSVEEGEDAECCDFAASDGYPKVVAFYEKALATTALTMEAAAKKYPALSGRLRQLKRQMTPGVEYRAFALPQIEGYKAEAPPLFELVAAAGAVYFTIPQQSLAGSDLAFVKEFKTRTNSFTEDEKMAERNRKMEEKAAADEDAELKRQAGLWSAALGQNEVKVFPGARYQGQTGPFCTSGGDGDQRVPCTLCSFESDALPAKVESFYGGSQVKKGCVSVQVAVRMNDEGKENGSFINIEYDSACKGGDKLRADLFREE